MPWRQRDGTGAISDIGVVVNNGQGLSESWFVLLQLLYRRMKAASRMADGGEDENTARGKR